MGDYNTQSTIVWHGSRVKPGSYALFRLTAEHEVHYTHSLDSSCKPTRVPS